MRKTVVGLLAHVDAGKTTLAEAMLYQAGKIRKYGRVDHGDTLLDTHGLEKARGITIFAGQAVFTAGDVEITLLDTPGHVDFSAETERMMQAMDYAILVISGAEGVQAHTKTLWRLIKAYNIPALIFVTKMDFARRTKESIMDELRQELGESCIDFTDYDNADTELTESLALCSERLLEKFLAGNKFDDSDIGDAVRMRGVFPCLFGSGLKLQGIDRLLESLCRFTVSSVYPEKFGAKVFKISRDSRGCRLTHLKVTGGVLRVRESVGTDEKITQIRIYSGDKFVTAETVAAGGVCAVTGLEKTQVGQGFGIEIASPSPYLEPIMKYRVALPEGCDAASVLQSLRQLGEEDPQLHVVWDDFLQEIQVSIMGEVQAEILKGLIAERLNIDAEIDAGRVIYKESIENTVEGVGHYEPLRHYAEVHLLLEPLPRGSGLVFETKCSESSLERGWQRLILSNLYEKQHVGVLTGSPLTDVRITLMSGRAHIKHTDGGDFRQAVYRGVRQGLMQAHSVLLEPYYRFKLEVQSAHIGRAINDIQLRSGTFEAPEVSGPLAVLKGKAPVSTMNGYSMEVISYTCGQGRLICEPEGYDICHNQDEVIRSFGYSPEGDLENTPDSVFCINGGGFTVKWSDVSEYMHLESCLIGEKQRDPDKGHRCRRIDDSELEAIMEWEFGKIKRPVYVKSDAAPVCDREKLSLPEQAPQHIIVDGYNVIFAWESLRELAGLNLEAARNRLMNILSNYAAFVKCELTLVFDAYKTSESTARRFDFHNIHIVYTKEKETADMYIEKLTAETGKDARVRVVTSDGLIQLSAVRFGVMRMSAVEFEKHVDCVRMEIAEILKKTNSVETVSIGEYIGKR